MSHRITVGAGTAIQARAKGSTNASAVLNDAAGVCWMAWHKVL